MRLSSYGAALLLLALIIALSAKQAACYGVDCSFPITTTNNPLQCDNENEAQGSQRQDFFDEYMQGCINAYSEEFCQIDETTRRWYNTNQPQSIVNYTMEGFRKLRAPDSLRKMLTKFWEANKDQMELEEFSKGGIFVTNHWSSPSYVVDVANGSFVGGGNHLKKATWDAAKDVIEDWTSIKLRPSSLYGIRVYSEGAVLAPHVDRIPLVSSAIVNVAQDVDEDWPLEVYDRKTGNAINLTMEPGDMILYESASMIHGRPFPLKGRFYASVFIHFEPVDLDPGYEGYHQSLPPYLVPGSQGAVQWLEENQGGCSQNISDYAMMRAMHYAALGLLDELKELAEEDRNALTYEGKYGWQPIHEAARSGHLEVVKYLVENGVDINARTLDGDGPSPLNIAKLELGLENPVYQLLKSVGAKDIEWIGP